MHLFDHLDHDHDEFRDLLTRIRASLRSDDATLNSARHALHGDCVELRDTFIVHFGEEEETVFPAVVDALPDATDDVARLISAHDVLCGTALRLVTHVERGGTNLAAERGQLDALFERLERAYGEHAQLERSALKKWASRLPEEAKARLR
jgi:hypothetical protein